MYMTKASGKSISPATYFVIGVHAAASSSADEGCATAAEGRSAAAGRATSPAKAVRREVSLAAGRHGRSGAVSADERLRNAGPTLNSKYAQPLAIEQMSAQLQPQVCLGFRNEAHSLRLFSW